MSFLTPGFLFSSGITKQKLLLHNIFKHLSGCANPTSCNLEISKFLFLFGFKLSYSNDSRLLLHQAYHFLVVDVDFRIRRRNQWRIMQMFSSQINQQNVPQRRRAWFGPCPQTLFRTYATLCGWTYKNSARGLEFRGQSQLFWHLSVNHPSVTFA